MNAPVTSASATERLRALLSPQSVALIGASDNAKKLTARPMVFMRNHGFAGLVFPINPARETVLGEPAFSSLQDVQEPIDHAYILLDSEPAMAAFRQCIEARVKVVSILADGFAEAGPEGLRRQQELTALADEAGILLIGPNSMGVVGPHSGFACTANAAFAAEQLPPGRLAVLSQSGSVIGTLFSRGHARGIAFSALISVGNEAQSGVGELGSLLLDDPNTDGFLLFMETIRNRDSLASFARRANELGKPVVAYMIGRSDEGQALSVSHTGAMTGQGAAIDSFLRSIGVRRVETFEALLEAPAALGTINMPAGRPRAVTVVSTTGGGGAMVVDQLSLRGVEIAGCSPEARAKLEARGIPLGHGKLVDVTLAGARYDMMKAVLSTIIADPQTGAVVVAIGSSAQFNPELAVTPIVDAVAEAADHAAPVLAFPLPQADESLRRLAAGGVPTFRTVESCAETVALLMRPLPPIEAAKGELPMPVRHRINQAPSGLLDEVSSSKIFAALNIMGPQQTVLGPDESVPAKLPFVFPVVAKLISADIPHKTEAGAIQIGIGDRETLLSAISEMKARTAAAVPDARIAGILIQEMCSGLGEALIGLSRDPLAGPTVMIGMGGVLAEIYRDVSIRPAPVSLSVAHEMIDEVKGFAVFRGFRGMPRGDLDALAQAIKAISLLAAEDRVIEAEVNPVLVKVQGGGVVALDALVRLE